jgi:hypothetical protein
VAKSLGRVEADIREAHTRFQGLWHHFFLLLPF